MRKGLLQSGQSCYSYQIRIEELERQIKELRRPVATLKPSLLPAARNVPMGGLELSTQSQSAGDPLNSVNAILS